MSVEYPKGVVKMIRRILLGLAVGAIVGFISSNILIGLNYSRIDVITPFQSTLINSMGIFFGIIISLLVCLIIEVNEK